MQAQSRAMGNSWKTASSAVRAAVAARRLQTNDSATGGKKKTTGGKKVKKPAAAEQSGEKSAAAAEKQEGGTGAAEQTNKGADETGPAVNEAEQKAAAEAMEETLPLILETMLNICLMDIEQSVRAAAKKVLKDMSVDLEMRRLRAEGVMRLGQLLQTAAEEHRKSHTEKVDARRQMEEAFIRAAQKADDDNRS
eukprot:GHVS01063528.1.p1 GENE.GHVS01063528.1~~GHVS01063528.1.p1  ORF type:complete len:194 (-),score=55.80 GHVS01063528.1:9-590(-)